MSNIEQNAAAKVSLIKNIMAISPKILSEDILNKLTYEELSNIYSINRRMNYYENVIKKQKIYVIQYVYGNKYSLVYLYSISDVELDALYLKSIKKTQTEFELYIASSLEDFKNDAIAGGYEEYLSFSKEEMIIAAGIIVPENLLTEEEYVSKSLLYRIHQIQKKITALRTENEEAEAEIAVTRNYTEITELRGDIRYNNQCIIELQNELQQLVSENDSLTLVRKKNGEE